MKPKPTLFTFFMHISGLIVNVILICTEKNGVGFTFETILTHNFADN